MRTLVLIALTACFEPTETSATGMVGRVFDVTGAPVVGLRVESVEEGIPTDARGGFAVQTQPPNGWVGLRFGGAYYRRTFQPADDGQKLVLRLPALTDVEVRCERVEACDVVADWELGEGFTARATIPCTPGEQEMVRGLPTGAPTAVACRDGAPVALTEDAGAWRLTAARRRVTVTTGQVGCVVSVGDVAAQPTASGGYTAEVAGRALAVASCAGDVRAPVWVAPGATAVAVDDVGHGRISLGPGAPEQATLLVRPTDGPGWSMAVRVVSGEIAVPPLPVGDVWVLAPDAPPPLSVPEGSALRRIGDGPGASWFVHVDREVREAVLGPPG